MFLVCMILFRLGLDGVHMLSRDTPETFLYFNFVDMILGIFLLSRFQ
jgi:hypothetical protein